MKLLFAGDFCPFDGYDVKFDGEIKRHFQDADYSFVNLECPLTNETKKIAKCGPNLKASPQQIRSVQSLGAKCVTLANNHLLDYGGKAVMDTIRICRENGILSVGAGADLADARKPLVLESGGMRVAIINAAEREFSIAGKHSPGANLFDLIHLLEDIVTARKLAKKIVLVVHGGLEHVAYPSPESIRILRFLAEQENVVAVIRHHPHVIQGMELWKGVPIYYSLGNFCFPDESVFDDAWCTGLTAELELNEHEVKTSSFQVRMEQEGSSRESWVKYQGVASFPEVEGALASAAWREAFEGRQLKYMTNLFSPWGLIGKVIRKLRLFDWLKPSRAQILLLQNYLRCPAHFECLRHAIGIDEES